jgi:hypothetical protein
LANYIVSYDLHKQRHYPPIWAAIERLRGVRLLESLWLIETNLTAVQVRDILSTSIDSDDSIAVIELKENAYWACLRVRQSGLDRLRQSIAA